MWHSETTDRLIGGLYFEMLLIMLLKEVVKTTTLEQDPPNHKRVGQMNSHSSIQQ